MKSKFLVLYPDPKNLDQIIQKANLQHAKNGPFEAVILLGSSVPAQMPSILPDTPTYFFGNTTEEGSFVDVGRNFVCVKARNALLKLANGVSLAFFNDTLEPSEDDSTRIAKADILFSYNWPYAVAASQKLTLVGDAKVDSVVKNLQPRYHFAAGTEMGRAYEHAMVAWNRLRSYRFVSLAREGSGGKWFYAFAIDANDDDTTSAAKNPFLDMNPKRPRDDDIPELAQASVARLPPKRIKIVAPSECFFCLSNPRLESHMIVSIGKLSYMTIAKGPLTRPGGKLDFSGHAILIPIDHSATMPDSPELKHEIGAYQGSLVEAFGEQGYDVVFYEISRPENVHFHIQMVPVPLGLVGSQFERALEEKTRINNETFEHNSKLDFHKFDGSNADDEERRKIIENKRYVQFTVYAGAEKSYYISALDEDNMADLQFPRRVLAFLLRLPKRVNWDRCRQTTSQETSEAQKFKKFYGKYDISK